MKLCVALFVLCVPSVALAGTTCKSDGDKVKNFDGQYMKVSMPCKYPAIYQQKCGKFEVTVTPGHMFLYPDYEVNSLWVAIKREHTSDFWEGRTDNTQAVKYFKGWKDELFVKKGGNLNTNDVLQSDAKDKETWAGNEDFTITFRPWDPSNPKFTKSGWKFTCSAATKPNKYITTDFPHQICGNKKSVKDIGKNLTLAKEEQVVFTTIFNNSNIAQTNENCTAATNLITNVCTEAQRIDAMTTCTQILASKPHRMCLTKYTCDPMDIFVACIRWVCSDEEDVAACEAVGEAIDLCRNFSQGNLTERVKAKNCYTGFHQIPGEYEEEEDRKRRRPKQ